MENQRTLLDILSKQRDNSGEKNLTTDKNRKKNSSGNLRTTLDLQPRKQNTAGVSRLS